MNVKGQIKGRGERVKGKGFSLVEMIIALTVFMIFVGISTQSYTSLVRANRTANSTQKIYRDIRHVFDVFAEDIRRGTVDFECVKGENDCLGNAGSIEQRMVGLIEVHDGEKTRSIYAFKDGRIYLQRQIEQRTGDLKSWAPITEETPLTAASTKLENVSFNVFPSDDPYAMENAGLDALQWQPSVGITVQTPGGMIRTRYTSRSYGKPLYAKSKGT